MFVLCFQITNIDTTKLIIKYGGLVVPIFKNIKSGKKIAAEILDKDTILNFARIIKKIPNDENPTFQERAINIPKPVATAFPPFPFNHMGHICPEIAEIPAKTTNMF